MYKSIAIALLASLLASAALAQDIYRVVDEHGNVTYTDQKPDDDARPMELPELNVLEGEPAQDEPDPLAAAARPSMDFRLLQPADGAVIAPQDDLLKVVMSIAIEVPPTAQIVLVLDGQPLAPIHALETEIPLPDPGEHRLFARLETPSGRVLGTTEAISFTVRALDQAS